MIDKKCPECGALLKKKDIKNDKCWRCKKENIAEYFNTQEEKGEDKSLSSMKLIGNHLTHWTWFELALSIAILWGTFHSYYSLDIYFEELKKTLLDMPQSPFIALLVAGQEISEKGYWIVMGIFVLRILLLGKLVLLGFKPSKSE